MDRWKKLKISEKVRYIIGIFFIIGGISGIFSGDFLSGLLIGIFGVSLFPIIYEKLNISTEKKLHIIIPIILFLVASIFMPSSSEEMTNKVDYTTNTEVNEMIIEENHFIENKTESSEENEKTENSIEEERDNKVEEKDTSVSEKSTTTSSSDGQTTKTNNLTTEEAKEESTSTITKDSNGQTTEPYNPAIEEAKNEDTTTESSISTENTDNSGTVYVTPYGKKYHLDAECGGENSSATTLNKAINSGRTPCKKCAQ